MTRPWCRWRFDGVAAQCRWWGLLSWAVAFSGASTWGAACCGGMSSGPGLLPGGDKASLSGTYSFSETVVDSVGSDGVWRTRPEHLRSQTLVLEGAHALPGLWQVGLAVPSEKKCPPGGRCRAGLGDISASLAYEFLPEWDYQPLRPDGFLYLRAVAPTGRNRAESALGGLDSRGTGLWALALGTVLSKAFGRWDLSGSIEAHRSFSKELREAPLTGQLQPGWGGTSAIGGGYSMGSWRAGASLRWTYEDPTEILGPSPSRGALERYATGSLSLSYALKNAWAATLTYADQTWFGSPLHTSLSRSASLQIQRRWAR